jgi:Fe-S-cluster containining protein
MACQRCGKCCRTYAVAMARNADYARFLSFHGLVIRERPDGGMEVYGESKCRHLRASGQTTSCAVYDERPTICREWACERCT